LFNRKDFFDSRNFPGISNEIQGETFSLRLFLADREEQKAFSPDSVDDEISVGNFDSGEIGEIMALTELPVSGGRCRPENDGNPIGDLIHEPASSGGVFVPIKKEGSR